MCINYSSASIGYFESYGWPTYGVVKPWWLAPFSDHPSRPISGYSRKHDLSSGGSRAGLSESFIQI